jgi:hypothetical protein
MRQCPPKQTGHWTRQGILNEYLIQTPSDPKEYSTFLTYTGSTTFNPIRLRIKFNQPLDGVLAPQSKSKQSGVFMKSIPGNQERNSQYSVVKFCNDLKIQIKSDVLTIECPGGQMNTSDGAYLFIHTVRQTALDLEIADIERWEKD